VAAIDCGTNSIRLLIADVADGDRGARSGAGGAGSAGGAGGKGGASDKGGGGGGDRLTDVVRRMEIVRLGQGVDRTGRLAPDAVERARIALRGFADEIAALGVTRIRMVATSATRDATNTDEFTAMVIDTLGVPPEVVTGVEEARLSFTGAVRGLPADLPAPYLVIDIGGGSTEFVRGRAVGTAVTTGVMAGGPPAGGAVAGGVPGGGAVDGNRAADGGVDTAVSVDVGCVRMTERHLHTDPPTPAEVAAAEADVTAAVDRALAAVGGREARTLIGLAGSVTTVAAIALNLPGYDPSRIHHARIRFADVAKVATDLLAASRQQRLALPVMHPGRADVIGAGALILRTIMQRAGFDEVVASEHDILDGIAYSIR
jgi:exopolyphosphatase/guanosine-5'-triphosphate,3'-diphosphate pyrophosphatase